jgi:hypothetical protein
VVIDCLDSVGNVACLVEADLHVRRLMIQLIRSLWSVFLSQSLCVDGKVGMSDGLDDAPD